MQGTYRVRLGSRDLLETFVAAPGPMGWRYFGRLHHASTGDEWALVDHTVAVDWTLVRFRWRDADGTEVEASAADGGVEVRVHGRGDERRASFDGVGAVWSPSPSSLLVVDRLLLGSAGEVTVVRLRPPFEPGRVVVGVSAPEGRSHRSAAGGGDEREVDLVVDAARWPATLGPELPVRATGWFELVT